MLRHLLPSWLRALSRKRPDIDIDLREVGSGGVELLQRGETDLIVDHIPNPLKNIATQEVALVRAFVVVPKTFSTGGEFVPESLTGARFIAYHADREHYERQRRALELLGVTPGRVSYAGTSDTILGMVGAGVGFSILPSLLPDGPKTPGIFAHSMKAKDASFSIVAAWRKDAPPNPLLDAALQLAPQPE